MSETRLIISIDETRQREITIEINLYHWVNIIAAYKAKIKNYFWVFEIDKKVIARKVK